MPSKTTGPAARARPGPVLAALGFAVALLLVAVLMLVPSAAPVAGLGLAAGIGGVAAAVVALRRAGAAVRQAEKLSGEIDLLSGRLLRLEAAPLPAPGHVRAPEALAEGVAEVTAEIGLLGGIVRELAVAVEGQDREIADLRADREAETARAERTRADARRAAEARAAEAVRADAARVEAGRRAEEARLVEDTRLAEEARAQEARAQEARAEEARLAEAALAADRARALQAARPVQPRPTVPAAVEPPRLAPRPFPPPPRAPEVVTSRLAPPVRAAAPAPVPDDVLDRREAEIARALDEGQVEVHLQPVVTLPQRKVVLYEALPRLRVADVLLPPEAFLGALERRGRVPDLDRFLVARAATIARHLANRGSGAGVAFGLAPVSAAEPGFLRGLARLVDTHPDLAGRLVATLPQRTWRALDAEQAGALAALAGRGMILALDRAVDLRFDPRALAERAIRYVKVPGELLLRPRLLPSGSSTGPDVAVGDLATAFSRAGIGLVADGVEREEDVPDLLELDVPYAQGAAFAPPRAVRPEVLAPTEAAAPRTLAAPEPELPSPVVEEAEPPVRRSFRDFLRRAG